MLLHKTQKLIYASPRKKNFLNAVILSGKKSGQKSLGKIFILIETEDESIESAEISQGIIEVIKNQYYKEKASTTEERLEKTLQKLNDVLGELISLGKNKWVNSINALIAVIRNNQIYFSKTGKAYALLIRGRENISITEDSAPSLNYPVKIFKHILSGRIEAGDFLILGNATLFSYFSDHKLALISQRYKKLQDKKEMLLKIIQEEEIPKNIIALLLAVKKQKIAQTNEIKQENKAEEDDAEQAIQRRLQAKIKKKFPYSLIYLFYDLLIKAASLLYHQILKGFIWQKILPFTRKLVLYLLKKSKKNIKKIFRQSKKDKSYKKYYSVKLQSKTQEDGQSLSFINNLYLLLFRKKKLVLVSLSVMLLVFSSALVIFKKDKKEVVQDPAVNVEDSLTQAKNKKDQAENALIFNDEEKAKDLLSQAQELTQQVLGEKTENTEAQKLDQEIKDQMAKIYKLEKVDNLSLFSDLANLKEDLNIKQILNLGNELYFYTDTDNNLIKLNLENKETKILSPNFSEIEKLETGTNVGTEILAFLSEKNNVFTYNPQTNKLEKTTDINLEGDLTQIKGYTSRLFIADASNNQIFRFSKTLAGFSKPTEWLVDPLEISQVKDLAIDGSIYCLKTDGAVEKYFKGKKEDFQLAQTDLDFKQVDKIFTAVDYQNLYFSSKQAKRITIFNKKGELVKQLLLEDIESLDDFWVDLTENKIFVLSNNKILEISL